MAIVSDARTFSSADLFNPANVYDLSSSSRTDIRKLALALRFTTVTTAEGLWASESVEQLVSYGINSFKYMATSGNPGVDVTAVFTLAGECPDAVPESKWLPAVQDLYETSKQIEGLHSVRTSYRASVDEDTMAQLISLLDFVRGYGSDSSRQDLTPLLGRYSMYPYLDVKTNGSVDVDRIPYDTVITALTIQSMLNVMRNQPATEEPEPITLARRLRVDLTGASEYQRRAIAEWMASDRSVNGRYDSRNRAKVGRMSATCHVYFIDFDGELLASMRFVGDEVRWQDVWSQVGQERAPEFTAWHVHLDTIITVEQLCKLADRLNTDAAPDCPVMEVGDLFTRISNGLDAVGVDSEGAILLASVGKCLTLQDI